MKNSTAIIIPACDLKGSRAKQQLERLLESIKDYTKFDIIVCFDSCSPEFIRYFEEKYPVFESVVWTGNRQNFARNVNLGLALCLERDQNALVVNQDCKMPREQLIQDGLCQFVGVCNPLCTDQLDLPEGNGLINEYGSKFAYFCTFIHLDVIKKVGMLDGIFYPNGGCEDDDHMIRAKLAGFKAYVANVNVYHEGSYIDASNPMWESASGSYNSQTLGISLNKLYTKYQVDPGIPHEELMNYVLTNRTWKDSMYIAPRR